MTPVPEVLHRIWLDEEIPAKFEAFWTRFRELHPTWVLVTWNNSKTLDWLRCPEVFWAATTHAGRSDVLRYEILARYGGVYVDCDVEPLRPFDDLLEDERPFAGWEDSNLICPTVMGAPPEHPAVLDLLEHLPVWARRHNPRYPNQQTGPEFLTPRWGNRTDVRLLPSVAFYPVHWSAKDQLGGPYPSQSYAVHHWAANWQTPEGQIHPEGR